MTIPILVPRRADGGRRDELWHFCRRWWEEGLPGWPICEGASPDGLFNRGAAINDAARGVSFGAWDVALIADGDVICEPTQVRLAVERARSTNRLTLAYDDYVGMTRQMTDRVLTGYGGDWRAPGSLRMRTHVSSLLAVPRRLWDEVGGYDERFVGWGFDDNAFHAACRVMGGGVERAPGTVFHLWHPDSPERDWKAPHCRAGSALAARYAAAREPDAMRALIRERDPADGYLLMVLTDGRRDCIGRTLGSFREYVGGLPVTRTVIHDDSGDPDYQAWLRLMFPSFTLVCGPKRLGFAGAMRRAWDTALASGQRFTFWLEDDFKLRRTVDLGAMARVLDRQPELLQMALRRQAWFEPELAAGGVIERNPDAFLPAHTRVRGRKVEWLEHREFWTMNPCLIPRRTLAAHEWPAGRHSELQFTRRALRNGAVCGYWGRRDDEPWVEHFGERVGSGY